MGWSKESVDLMEKLWKENHSANEIAIAIGNGATRSAVLGKIHRLGLSGRRKVTAARKSRASVPRAPMSARRVVAKAPKPPALKPATFTPKPIPDAPDMKPCGILELTSTTCRFPLDDPRDDDFRYCGGASDIGDAYCAYHMQLCYTPAGLSRARAAAISGQRA